YVNTIPVASLIRRSALLEAGGWRMGSGYEDWDLWLAVAEQGLDGVHVPVPTFRYRRRAGRMLDDCTPRHAELYDRLRSRHPDLFAARRESRRRSTAPLRTKLLFPVLESMPIDPFTRHRLYLLVNGPRQIVELRRRRRSARRRAA